MVFLLLSPVIAKAQQGKISEIKNNDKYYWGEACTQNISTARDNSRQNLISKIAVRVSTKFESKVVTKGNQDSTDIEKKTKNVIESYSTATLKNLQAVTYQSDCGVNVFSYITKEQVQEIFDERKDLIRDLYFEAKEFQSNTNYSAALKYYYFSLVLMNSVPEPSISSGSYNLTTIIPSKINEIIESVEFKVLQDTMISDDKREVTLGITSNGKPVSRLDFSYWNGNANIASMARDGKSTITFYSSATQMQSLSLDILYDYYEQRDEITEVSQIWNLVSKPSFGNTKRISLKKDAKGVESPNKITKHKAGQKQNVTSSKQEVSSQQQNVTNANGYLFVGKGYPSKITSQTQKFVSYFKNQQLPKNWEKDAFLKDKLHRVKTNNQVNIKNQLVDSLHVNNSYEGWEVRKFPVLCNYETIDIQSNEYLVPDFNKKGLLQDVNFGVMDGLYNKVKYQASFADDWENRKVIIKFLEKYRTAFLSRDLDQLRTMFADNAVIIVGRVLKQTKAKNQYKYEQSSDQPDYETIRLSKQEYLKRQARLFDEKKDLFLEYSTFKILKKNTPGIYGVSLRQHYYSSNYSDEGYLFLLIDFNGQKPKIHVRAWQPNQWNEESLIKTANFNVNY